MDNRRRYNLLCPVIAIIIFSGFYFLFSGLYFQKPPNRTYSQTPHFNGVKEFQQHFREADEKRLYLRSTFEIVLVFFY